MQAREKVRESRKECSRGSTVAWNTSVTLYIVANYYIIAQEENHVVRRRL